MNAFGIPITSMHSSPTGDQYEREREAGHAKGKVCLADSRWPYQAACGHELSHDSHMDLTLNEWLSCLASNS